MSSFGSPGKVRIEKIGLTLKSWHNMHLLGWLLLDNCMVSQKLKVLLFNLYLTCRFYCSFMLEPNSFYDMFIQMNLRKPEEGVK